MSEQELAESLRHCRAMVDAADELQAMANRRAEESTRALRAWRGPRAETFRAQLQGDEFVVGRCVASLRREADEWAQIWADAVNEENRRRHEAAVTEVRSRRGAGEQFVDLFVGDDSEDQVRELVPVAVPRSSQRYAATGELVHY